MKTLIVVDMQKGFITKNNEFLQKNIEKLLKNSKFDKIIATKFVNSPQSPYAKFLDWHRFTEADEQQIVVALPKNTQVIEKTSYALPDEIFAGGGIKGKECYLCGTDYDSCVLAIMFQLFDHNIRPYVIWDCVGSHSNSPIEKEELKKLIIKNFGKNSII